MCFARHPIRRPGTLRGDPIWQQQGDGEVFVGSWADSFFGAREPLQLPIELFDGNQGNPGATFNQAQRIVSVSLAANQMGLKWKKQ